LFWEAGTVRVAEDIPAACSPFFVLRWDCQAMEAKVDGTG
jgi:hypothetical protein